jgi:hypothetical protein
VGGSGFPFLLELKTKMFSLPQREHITSWKILAWEAEDLGPDDHGNTSLSDFGQVISPQGLSRLVEHRVDLRSHGDPHSREWERVVGFRQSSSLSPELAHLI